MPTSPMSRMYSAALTSMRHGPQSGLPLWRMGGLNKELYFWHAIMFDQGPLDMYNITYMYGGIHGRNFIYCRSAKPGQDNG